MGNPQSKIQNEDNASLSKNLLNQLTQPKIAQKFQKAEFFYKTKQMKIHLPIQNRNILSQWDQSFKTIVNEEMKKYILLPKQYLFQIQGICGTAGLVKIVYDYFPYSLQGQIQNRKKSINNQQFSQTQVWKLLLILLKAAYLMHLNWKKIGDIRPKNIFLNSQKQIRVSSQLSNPRQLTNYQKFIFKKQITYIAPQQLQDIKMGRIQPDTSRNAKQHIIEAQSWSIGLTLLHITLLFNCQRLYQPLKNEFNIELLRQKIQDLQKNNKISLALKNIIRGMLEQIPQRRLLCSQLLSNFLSPYIQEIMNLRSFDSSKLNSQIKQLMGKKTTNSLIKTVWVASTSYGILQSLVLNTERQNQQQKKAKQTFLEQIEKFSQIPRNSQVSIRQSIRLGGSVKTLKNSLSKIKTSQVSNESFHTVNSKKSSLYNQQCKISNFSLQNRFGTGALRVPTIGSNFSPTKYNNFQMTSQKFMTPLGQSSYFQTIQNNQKSFDINNNFGLLSSTFRHSQALQQKDFIKLKQKITNQNKNFQLNVIQGNFKKNKGKSKQILKNQQ